MVGALPSNRCETCRIRKVKCDQGWPVCGQCKRGNRVCPPRSALKIVDEGAQFQQLPSSSKKKTIVSYSSASQRQQQEKSTARDDENAAVFINSDEYFPCRRVDKIIPLSASERLSFGIINTVCIEIPSFSLRIIGEFIWQIPQLLGRSRALDSVVACMLASHKHLLYGGDPAGRINRQLYSRACHRLQLALNDSREWCSLSTVYATVFMHRIEAVFGHLPNRAIAVHASGLSALIQKRGPPDINNQMELQITMDCHLSIIQLAVARRQYCFLASDEWVNALDTPLDDVSYSSNLKMVYFRLIRLMACWPTLVREYSQLREGGSSNSNNSGSDGDDVIDHLILLYKRACTVLEGLKYINHDLGKVIQDQKLITTVPSSRPNDPLPLMFQVKDTMAALAICHYAMITIVVCRILVWVLEEVPYIHLLATSTIPYCETEEKNIAELQTEITSQCHRIWMLIEHSRRQKPLGLPVMQAALSFTFESAIDEPDLKQNILDAMNELGAFQVFDNGPWREEQLVNIARSMRGEFPAE